MCRTTPAKHRAVTLCISLLLAALLASGAAAQEKAKPRKTPGVKPSAVLVIKTSRSAKPALEAFERRYGRERFDCLITGEDVDAARLARAKVVFLEHPSQPFLERVKEPMLAAIENGLLVLSDVPEVVQRAWGVEVPLPLTRRLMAYWQNGGEENMRNFFAALYLEAGGLDAGGSKEIEVEPAKELARMGVYHPDAPHTFADMQAYLAWYRKAKPAQKELAVVTFFQSYLRNEDLDFVDAMLRALEKQGLAAAGAFGWPLHSTKDLYNQSADDPLKVSLSFTLSLSKPEDATFLEEQNVHVISLMTTRESYDEWAASDRGVPVERVNTSLASPERNGATESILVATTEADPGTGLARTAPIAERVEMAAARARRWVELGRKANAEKRLVMLYYNNPPGKGNLGASYMNLPPSIRAVLAKLREEGYDVGEEIPSEASILAQLETVGRNVETWAPGELDAMVKRGGVLLPVSTYRRWFKDLPQAFKELMLSRWGEPEKAELMVWHSREGKPYFVIPGLALGKIHLGPQLLRASFAEYTNVQHSKTLPPHHGYVAAYLYYRHIWKADAVLHMGRHGTLEWLPGKNAGQAGWDCSEVILGDLPNVNYYIMDGGGEAIQARRRGAAVDLSHLTPMIVQAGKEDRFAALAETLLQWRDTRENSPALAEEYAIKAMPLLKSSGLDKQLALAGLAREEQLERASAFLEELEDATLPLGLATLGEMPTPERQEAGLQAYLRSAFGVEDLRRVSRWFSRWTAAVFRGAAPEVPSEMQGEIRERIFRAMDDAHGWLARLRDSPDRELAMLPRVLRGEFLPSGIVGDPLGVPDALPSGRNLHQGDPALLPTKAGWELGKKLAKQLLEGHKERNGRYPERISMVLWSGETGRHEGAMEAEALYLMGVEPEWNARGIPDRLKLIPEGELGRPRVNVVFTASGLYRDSLGDKIVLLDRAARLAAASGDNAISRQNRAVQAALVATGVPAEEAAGLAAARVFSTAPGAYGLGLEKMVEQSRDVDEAETMAQLYLTKMNFVYSEKTWGGSAPKLLENQLSGNESIVHSRSSNLYGAVDNDDVYQWMGGLRIASEAAGAKPELMMQNVRQPGREKTESARDFLAKELNARNWNPQWLKEMQKEGYAGAREMSKAVEYLYGWQATAPETLAPEVWKKTYDVYVADEYNLGLKGFFDGSNPAMRQNLLARLLEVDRQGTYRFSEEERSRMVGEYVRLVSQNGVACSANVCGNRKLQLSVAQEAQRMVESAGDRVLSSEDLAQFTRRFDEAAKPASRDVQRWREQSQNPPETLPEKQQDWRVNLVRVKNFTVHARKVISENPLVAGGVAFGLVLFGLLVALQKRRRGMEWAELQITALPSESDA